MQHTQNETWLRATLSTCSYIIGGATAENIYRPAKYVFRRHVDSPGKHKSMRLVNMRVKEELNLEKCWHNVLISISLPPSHPLTHSLNNTRPHLLNSNLSIWQTYLRTYAFPKPMRERAIDFFYYTYNNNKVIIPIYTCFRLRSNAVIRLCFFEPASITICNNNIQYHFDIKTRHETIAQCSPYLQRSLVRLWYLCFALSYCVMPSDPLPSNRPILSWSSP